MKPMQVRPTRLLFALGPLAFALTLSGCKSYWVETTVENQTGHALHELEVDYPSASFGINVLAAGATSHYHFSIRDSGPVKVQYTLDTGKIVNAHGLDLHERQQGTLTIRLLPDGKVDFLPSLTPEK